jgi:hypothetical protein
MSFANWLARFVRELCVGKNGIDYDLVTTVTQQSQSSDNVRVHASIGAAAWGAPHDSLEDAIVVSKPI